MSERPPRNKKTRIRGGSGEGRQVNVQNTLVVEKVGFEFFSNVKVKGPADEKEMKKSSAGSMSNG